MAWNRVVFLDVGRESNSAGGHLESACEDADYGGQKETTKGLVAAWQKS